MSLEDSYIEKQYFLDIKKHIIHNYVISEFYDNLYSETREEVYRNRSKAIDFCCALWDVDHYMMQGVKHIKRLNLCRDKFCYNCQTVLAQARKTKFEPILDSFRKDCSIAHIVVTVPNCEAEELLPTLVKMYNKFPFLMRYFKGSAKVKGVDFLKYGYRGAVRSLEVTYNRHEKTYHPHFHCMVALGKDVDYTGKYINKYSFDERGVLRLKFSELAILLQKLWFLLMNDEKVTAKSIEGLSCGYDVHVSDSEGYYNECFKYACKGTFDEREGAMIYNEPVFRTLYEALKNRRIIQGYGAFHNFSDLDSEKFEAEFAEEYEKYIEQLRSIEKPDFRVESLDEVIERSDSCRYTSKTSFKRYLRQRMIEQREQDDNAR